MKRLLSLINPLRLSGLVFLGVGLVLVSVALWFVFFTKPRDFVYPLRLSMGRKIQPEKRITTFFMVKERAKKHGLDFTLVDTQGSEDSLARIDCGELDLAVIKGGLLLGDKKNVRQVTALDVESFHLLVREPLLTAMKTGNAAPDYGALKGVRINVNSPSTGTHHWSLDILKFAGLTPDTPEAKGNFTPVTLGNPELLDSIARLKKAPDQERRQLIDQLPEAIVFADLVPSQIVQGLVDQANYRLVPLDFGPAYIRSVHASKHEVLDATVTIEMVSIPAYTYSVAPPIPKEACSTLGIRRLLVAHKDVPPEAIIRCLRMLYEPGSNTTLDLLEWDKVRPQYVLHDGVPMYDDDRKQVLQNRLIKFGERLASVMGGLIGGILAIYGYIRWRRLLRFEHYFHEIRQIEEIARGLRTDPAAPANRSELLAYLRYKLSDLRTAAITEFARGRLQGESLLLSIFTLIKDTSNFLNMQLGDKEK
jgi:NMT1-like family